MMKKVDLTIYKGFDECPDGAFYRGKKALFFKCEGGPDLLSDEVAAAIFSLIELARDGEKWREMNETRTDVILPADPYVHPLDATIRECAAKIMKELIETNYYTRKIYSELETIRLRGAR